METQVLSVSQLTNAISRVLEENIGTVSIQGEISNFKAHSSGHRYFTLKDEGAQISCLMWRSRTLNFQPADGMKVIITGKITVYPPRGNYQVECFSIKPVGQGDLYLAYEALKEKLEEQGYFDEDRKRAIPELPMRIGVSTSPTGAAIKDILSTIERRFPACKIYFRPTLVQGDGSAEDIVRAISELNKLPLDVIIIGRGGGSLEDLWAFNMEITANAIFNSKIPVVSAVGHETDFTIADFVADARAATPTAAAEMVTPFTTDYVLQVIDNTELRLSDSLLRIIKENKDIITHAVNSYFFRNFQDKIRNYIQFADESESRMSGVIKRMIENLQSRVLSTESHCKSLYPLSPLNKGFALLQSDNNFIGKDETLGNYIEVDILRASETVTASIVNIKKKSIFKDKFKGS
ncbi:exodeoxyribonuclease VII large subunit [Bacteroidota bacterium]